jgi:GNAT superfamily N-acetyltransferase
LADGSISFMDQRGLSSMPKLSLVSPSRNEVSEKLITARSATGNGNGQLRIRLAKLEESGTIAALTNAIFRGGNQFSLSDFASAAEVEQLMTKGTFLLAENHNGIVGCAYLEPRMGASRLELLAVSPSERRTGIGSQLLETAERISRSLRCMFIHVQVVNLNWETVTFCRRRGYIDFALEPLCVKQPLSPHCHIVRMSKKLDTDCFGF